MTGKEKLLEILRTTILSGKLRDLERRILDRIFHETRSPSNEYADEKASLLELLRREREKEAERRRKLSSVDFVNSFNEYLLLFTEEHSVADRDIAFWASFEADTLQRLNEDPALLFKLPPNKVALLTRRMKLTLDQAKQLIKKTFDLAVSSPSVKGAMARYAPRNGLEDKPNSMKNAVQELFLKASHERPFSTSNSSLSDADFNRFISEFEKSFNTLDE